METFHKTLKSNAALSKSPTRRVRTQSNHCFLAIYAAAQLEGLRVKHHLNHFALRSRLYVIPDFDGNGQVGFLDLLLFVDAFDSREGQENYDAKYDLNGNGEIDFSDFLLFIDNYGKEVSTPSGGDSGAMYCPLI